MSDQFAQQGVDTEYAESDVQATGADSVDAGLDAVVDAQADGATLDETVDETVDQSTDTTSTVEAAQVAEEFFSGPTVVDPWRLYRLGDYRSWPSLMEQLRAEFQ